MKQARVAPWMALALELGFDQQKILTKVRTLRSREAKKFGIAITVMEVVYGWDLDEMAMSLLHAIQHGRCRGPRCGRVAFRDLVVNPACLSLITGDIIDPSIEPVFCINFAWCCEQDNKGDRDRSMQDRARRLVEERLTNVQATNVQATNVRAPEKLKLFEWPP